MARHRLADASGLARLASYPLGKLKRMVGYGVVGLTGIAVDLSIVEAGSLLGVHHLLAVVAAFVVAMTWNFILQRRFVYNAAGNIIRQYCRYFVVDVSAFLVRFGIVVATVDLSSPWLALPYVPYPVGPAVPASVVGILAGFLAGFHGTDEIVFGGIHGE